MDPVLVIGGSGGLGSHIVTQLLSSVDATSVTVLDLNINRNRVDGARYVKSNVASYADVSKLLSDIKPRVIFHTASPHRMDQTATQSTFEECNIAGIENLLQCVEEVGGVKALVWTGYPTSITQPK
jgi:sterol-4alpha-carboxylate 3-dehydrogenase (decarboxylating)